MSWPAPNKYAFQMVYRYRLSRKNKKAKRCIKWNERSVNCARVAYSGKNRHFGNNSGNNLLKVRYELSIGYSVIILKFRFFCVMLSGVLSAQPHYSVNALQFFLIGAVLLRIWSSILDVSTEKEYNISGQLVGAAAWAEHLSYLVLVFFDYFFFTNSYSCCLSVRLCNL